MYIIWPFASGPLSLCMHPNEWYFFIIIALYVLEGRVCVCSKHASVSIFSDKTTDVIYQSFGHCDIFMMNYL